MEVAVIDWAAVLFWGLIASLAMTTIMLGAQGLGYTRLSFPFILGTMLSANPHRANAYGLVLFIVGGVLISLIYQLAFAYIGRTSWWLGALFGLFHGLFLVVVVLPMLPHFHPRMASEDDGPSTRRRLEPPGFLGRYYGQWTPEATCIGTVAYGIILGALTPPSSAL